MTDKQIEKAIAGKRNLFFHGPAGVGKSYWIIKYVATHSNCLVCAPTGIAALNVGGPTAHQMFHIPVPCFEGPSFAKSKKGAITKAQLNLISKADTVIVDEIPMLRNDAFSFMVKVIRKAEKIKGSKIRLIVAGDLWQLPPVVTKNDIKLLKKFGFHESGYCFTTAEWKSLNFQIIELEDVKRQTDKELIEMLHQVRKGNVFVADYFNQFVRRDYDVEADTESIYLCGTNAECNRLNTEYLNSLPGNTIALTADKSGRCSGSYIEDIILVKEGAKVIFTQNDSKKRFYNGAFGYVKKVYDDKVIVTLPDGKDVFVEKMENKLYTYKASGSDLMKNEIGCIKQYPFKLGRAITIHKAQGQTFDKMIISPEIFAAGQLYVALSRTRTKEGLILLDEIKPEHFIVDENVLEFVENGYKWNDIPKKPVAKKSVAKKTATKSTAKKTGTKKAGTKKAVAKKTTTKTAAKKSAAKKTTTKKVAAKKSVTKKPATKKVAATKAAAKSTAKKTSTKSVATKTGTKVAAKKSSIWD